MDRTPPNLSHRIAWPPSSPERPSSSTEPNFTDEMMKMLIKVQKKEITLKDDNRRLRGKLDMLVKVWSKKDDEVEKKEREREMKIIKEYSEREEIMKRELSEKDKKLREFRGREECVEKMKKEWSKKEEVMKIEVGKKDKEVESLRKQVVKLEKVGLDIKRHLGEKKGELGRLEREMSVREVALRKEYSEREFKGREECVQKMKKERSEKGEATKIETQDVGVQTMRRRISLDSDTNTTRGLGVDVVTQTLITSACDNDVISDDHGDCDNDVVSDVTKTVGQPQPNNDVVSHDDDDDDSSDVDLVVRVLTGLTTEDRSKVRPTIKWRKPPPFDNSGVCKPASHRSQVETCVWWWSCIYSTIYKNK